jgi:hypothetical protein
MCCLQLRTREVPALPGPVGILVLKDREDIAAEAGPCEVLAEELDGAGIPGEQWWRRRRRDRWRGGGGRVLQFTEGLVPTLPGPAWQVSTGGSKEVPLTPALQEALAQAGDYAGIGGKSW